MALKQLKTFQEGPYQLHETELEPIEQGGAAAVLVIHGFTATSRGMASVVNAAAEHGFDVYTPNLPGHGSHPDDLAHVSWRQWWGFVRDQYRELRSRYKEVHVVGQSLGAALVRLLDREETPPDRTVLLAIPWQIATPVARFVVEVLGRTPLEKRLAWTKDGGPDMSITEPDADEISYNWTPLYAVRQLNGLLRHNRRTVGAAPNPVLLLHSINDHTASYDGALRVLERLGPKASLLRLERSWHILTRDVEAREVGQSVARFLAGASPEEVLAQAPDDWKLVSPE